MIVFSQLSLHNVWNVVRHSEPGSCSLISPSDWDGATIHWINSDDRVGGSDIKWGSQRHSCTWRHTTPFGCRRQVLAKIRVFEVLKYHERYTGSRWEPRCLGEQRCLKRLVEPVQCQPQGRATSLLLIPGQCCKTSHLSMLWLSWLWVSAGSDLHVYSSALPLLLEGLWRLKHKNAQNRPVHSRLKRCAAGALLPFPSLRIPSFMPTALHDWKSSRHVELQK